MKSILLLMFVFINLGGVFAQNGERQNKKFDSVFYDTAVRMSAIDILKAEKIADSLFRTSTTALHKIKSLMLLADLLEKQNKREEAIAYVLRADSIASAIGNHEWEARISGFLSTQYRIIGLIDQGKRYLEKGLKASNKVTPQSASDQYKGMVHQEMAHYAMYDKDYVAAVGLLKKADLFFSDIKNLQMKNFFLGNNEEMLGRSYLGLEDYDTAKHHYNNALNFLDKAQAGESQWAGMIFHGLGKIALKNKEYQQALSYLKKADTIAKAMDHTYLKELVYRDLGGYYKAMGDLEKYSFYNTEYLKKIDESIKSARAATNGAMNRIYEEQQAGFSILHKVIFITGALLLLSLLLYYFTRKKRRKEREYYRAALVKLNTPKAEAVIPEVVPSTEKEERFMPLETEKALLKKLKKFETKYEFTNPSLTLSALAVALNTNTKYLSYVINTHKKKDFNNYVNDLRVFHIIKIIKDNPSYLNYKISYLSEECGFSSHSKFATIFKKTTGLTPSAFLEQVKKANKKEGQQSKF